MNAQAAVASIANPRYRYWPWFLLALLALSISFIPLPTSTAVPGSKKLRISASQYEFSPAVTRVNVGDRVTIELLSTDVVHGLYLDGYDLEVIADPGQTATLSFIADKSGTFRFRCLVTCGPLHPFMIGKLKVGSNTLLWRGLALAVLAAAIGFWRLRR
ncbi:MAG TPA: cupredoxin domain-containing protein [candidate division Zixibacteria bacterium]|nr:cupredoxin domain-containing protein [candidate division Zixibacteria bacterium]